MKKALSLLLCLFFLFPAGVAEEVEETGPWDGIRLVLFSGIHTHGTSGGSSWDHLLQMKIILQDDGRLRLEYYVRERDKVTDPNASPAMAETLVFFYDRK